MYNISTKNDELFILIIMQLTCHIILKLSILCMESDDLRNSSYAFFHDSDISREGMLEFTCSESEVFGLVIRSDKRVKRMMREEYLHRILEMAMRIKGLKKCKCLLKNIIYNETWK